MSSKYFWKGFASGRARYILFQEKLTEMMTPTHRRDFLLMRLTSIGLTDRCIFHSKLSLRAIEFKELVT